MKGIITRINWKGNPHIVVQTESRDFLVEQENLTLGLRRLIYTRSSETMIGTHVTFEIRTIKKGLRGKQKKIAVCVQVDPQWSGAVVVNSWQDFDQIMNAAKLPKILRVPLEHTMLCEQIRSSVEGLPYMITHFEGHLNLVLT